MFKTFFVPMLTNIWRILTSSKTGPFVLSGIIIAMLFWGYKFHNDFIVDIVKEKISHYESSSNILYDAVQKHEISKGSDGSKRIKLILPFLQERKVFYRELTTYFLANYYASIVMSIFTSIVTAILLVLIAHKGWASADKSLKATFFAFFFGATFFGFFPNVFKQEVNFNYNLCQFTEVDRIQVEIFNYLISDIQLGSVEQNKRYEDSLFSSVNKRLIDMDRIKIDIDESKMQNVGDIYKQISGTSQ